MCKMTPSGGMLVRGLFSNFQPLNIVKRRKKYWIDCPRTGNESTLHRYVKKVAANFDDIATVKDDVFFGGVNI